VQVTLPWFIVTLIFTAAFAVWVIRDRKTMFDRIDEALDLADQAMDDTRLVRVEDWMMLLIAEHKGEPLTQPIPVIDPDDGPPTQPQSLVLVREWSRDLEGPAEAWPQEPDGVESRSFGAHTFRFRTAEPLSPSAQE
jgi:hypothetical protein